MPDTAGCDPLARQLGFHTRLVRTRYRTNEIPIPPPNGEPQWGYPDRISNPPYVRRVLTLIGLQDYATACCPCNVQGGDTKAVRVISAGLDRWATHEQLPSRNLRTRVRDGAQTGQVTRSTDIKELSPERSQRAYGDEGVTGHTTLPGQGSGIGNPEPSHCHIDILGLLDVAADHLSVGLSRC